MRFLLFALLIAVPVTLLDGAAGLLLAVALRVRVVQVTVGMGPQLFERGIWRVRLVPLALTTRFATRGSDERAPGGVETGTIEAAPLPARVLLRFAPPVVLGLIAIAFEPRGGALSVLRGVPQFAAGALAPLSTAQRLLAGAEAAAARGGVAALVSIAAAKLCAVNALFVLAQLVAQIPNAAGRARPSGRVAKATALTYVGVLLALFAMYGSWCVAVARYALAS